MSIKGVLKNIKKKGVKGTWKIYKENKKRKETLEFMYGAFEKRAFIKMNPEEKNAFLNNFIEKEKNFKAEYPKEYKVWMKAMKAKYIKERIPEAYLRNSKNPVTNKVIFMENGRSPSPSSAHLSRVMKEEGKYELVYASLKIREVSYLEYYENALAFVEDAATAKAIFLSTANDILSHFDLREETKLIQLWHGVGVFKKVGYSTVDTKSFGKSAKDREEYNQYRNYDYVTIPAEEQSWIFEEAMRIDKESGIIVPVGVSRTDVFFDENYIKEKFAKLYEAYPQIEGKKIIFYGPTFRGAVANAQAPNALDIDKLAPMLKDDYVLIIKHHGLSKNVPPIPDQWKDTFAFDLGENKVLDIEALLAVSDILITDYSSIAFEFAIMEKPIVFFAYDLDEYIDKRGMYYDYDEITPGPVCKTNEEILDFILNIDEKFDKQGMHEFRVKHVGRCDGHSTERTIALIES